MVVVHRVFRRESALLPQLVRGVPDGDTTRAATVAGALRAYLVGLHGHHTTEDELIWPLLRDRATERDDLVARMAAQHDSIDETLSAVAELIPQWTDQAGRDVGERLASALDAHREALLTHLTDEEDLILPLVAEHLTVAEWELVGRRGLETVQKNMVFIALGAVLEDATPAEKAYFLGRVPAVGRLLWHLVGRRQYARHSRRVRGTSA
jgi:Hemerythrin HHE cation binding domain